MKQLTIERGRNGSLHKIADQLGVKWSLINNNYDHSWNIYAGKILDGLYFWCKDSGITDFATGHSQIAIQITFQNDKDAVLFKLRWHNA